jgi:hypothetical protein
VHQSRVVSESLLTLDHEAPDLFRHLGLLTLSDYSLEAVLMLLDQDFALHVEGKENLLLLSKRNNLFHEWLSNIVDKVDEALVLVLFEVELLVKIILVEVERCLSGLSQELLDLADS